jgi:hypothetical protein
MSAAPDTLATARAPGPRARALAGTRLRRLALRLRGGFTGARQAVQRMNRLIDAARLDHPDR